MCPGRKEYYEVPFAKLRCIVEPKFAERAIVKHSDYLKTGKVLQTAASAVTGSEVVTASGERVPFDILIVGTGTLFTGPTTKNELLKNYEAGK